MLRNMWDLEQLCCIFQAPIFRPQACNFVKKQTLAEVFSCEFCEISKNTFFTEHLCATASKYMINNHDKQQIMKNSTKSEKDKVDQPA